IDVQPRLEREVLQQFLIWSIERPADLTDDLLQLTPRDRHPHHIAEELADGRVGGVADPLEEGDQRRQARSDQAATFDGRRQLGITHLLAVRTPSRMAAMLFDPQRHLWDLDLLDDARRR